MKKIISLLLALVMVFALVACGGGNTDTPDASKAPTGDSGSKDDGGKKDPAPVKDGTQGVTDTEIHVGNSAGVSGALAAVGEPFVVAIETYFNMINEQGGIDGRKIIYHHKDDELDPIKGKAYLQELVEDEKIFCVLGHFGTPVVSATIDDLHEYGIPALYFATGISQLMSNGTKLGEKGHNIIPIQPIYAVEGEIMVARLVGSLGATKIGIIYTSDDAGKDMMNGATKKAEELGIPVVVEQVPVGTADASAAVTALKQAGVDGVVVGSIQNTMPTIVKEMAAQNMNAPAISTFVNAAVTIAEQIYQDIEGKFDVYTSSWKVRDEEHADDTALYIEKMPERFAYNTDGESGWIAAWFFCETLKRLEGKEVTWTSFLEALESAPYTDVPFSSTFDFSNGQRLGAQTMLLSKVNMDEPSGWEVVFPMATMDEILASV